MRSARPLWLTVITIVLLLATGPAWAEMGGEINLFLGEKKLSDDNLESLEDELDFCLSDQFEYGITSSFGNVDWPVAIAVDLLMADSDDSYTYDGDGYFYRYSVEVKTMELAAGVRKFWKSHEKFHPYVGGGIAMVKADVTLEYATDYQGGFKQTFTDSESIDDTAVGFWANTGVMWRFTDKLSLGLDVRYSDAEVEFDEDDIDKQPEDNKFDAGGFHYGIQFGFRW